MSSRPRPYPALFSVAVLTLILTLLLSSGALARGMFQTSPVGTPTPFVPTVAPPGIEPLPTEPLPVLEPPTSVPLPPTVGPTPTIQGFLPAPTIVNPNDLQSLPLAQPPVSGGDLAEPTVAPPASTASSAARVVVALVNYLWLLCGSALLIGGVVAIVLIWRRGRPT